MDTIINDKRQLKKVLYVENDFFSIELLKRILVDICQLDIALNGLSAIEMTKANNYSIIIMDINLGIGIDGLETTSRIRQLPKCKDIPIIALTSYALSWHRDEFLSKGCSHYFSKPIDIVAFSNFIQELLYKYE